LPLIRFTTIRNNDPCVLYFKHKICQHTLKFCYFKKCKYIFSTLYYVEQCHTPPATNVWTKMWTVTKCTRIHIIFMTYTCMCNIVFSQTDVLKKKLFKKLWWNHITKNLHVHYICMPTIPHALQLCDLPNLKHIGYNTKQLYWKL
jgi:hypothetical protein